MRVGFIVTSPRQLFHFEKIHRHFSNATIYVAVDERGNHVAKSIVRRHAPSASIAWVTVRDFRKIDGKCDVLVCQTPEPLLRGFSRSLTAAQQFSLANERHQYGAWRSLASLNMMFGPYSLSRVNAFSNAVATGNPLLDAHLVDGRIPGPPEGTIGKLRVLYVPADTASSRHDKYVRMLCDDGVSLTIGLPDGGTVSSYCNPHHAVSAARSHVDPIELILEHDVVVTDCSAVAFDSLAVRKPVVLTYALGEGDSVTQALYAGDSPESAIMHLVGSWTSTCSLVEAVEHSQFMLRDESRYREFLRNNFLNIGSAGLACAREIENLVQNGEICRDVVRIVRDAMQDWRLEIKPVEDVESIGRCNRSSRYGKGFARDKLVRAMRWGSSVVPWAAKLHAYVRTRRLSARLRTRTVASVPVAPRPMPVVPLERRLATLAAVEALLKARDLGYRTHVTGLKAYLAVLEPDLDELCEAMNALGREVGIGKAQIWWGRETSYSDVCYAESLRLADVVRADSIVVCFPYPDLQQLSRSSGIEILIVERQNRRYVARRRRAEKVDWTLEFAGNDGQDECISAGANRARARRHALEGEPIDIVYTWVDPADPEWKAARRAWAGQRPVSLESSDNDQRYLNRDELRYSLRSLWLHAPFVRNIFIVTAGHRPPWLDVTHSKVQVVPHSVIFPQPEDLPTFNSHAIEACLHRIPGLAEHFIYFNDDVFLGQETTVSTFFTKRGLIKSRLSPVASIPAIAPDMSATPTDCASYNVASVISRDFELQFDRKVKHVPMPLTRSLLNEIEGRYESLISTTRSAKFRAPTDLAVPSMLAPFYGICVGKAVECEHVVGEYVYADTGHLDLESRLSAIREGGPTFFCLNATRYSDIAPERQAMLLTKFLEEMYPWPSPYEVHELR